VRFEASRLAESLAAIDPGHAGARYCIAYSGGLDSTVLLHAMAQLRPGGGQKLRAVHVDHGLQAESARWAESCRASCELLGIALETLPVEVVQRAGESLEAAARQARYGAIERLLQPGERLLTAHHRDDQLETVLIQLFRGAGVAGLAAMPSRQRFGRGWHLRPLLDVDRADLAEYASRHGLAWHEDPMNESLRYDRGWLRARVLPAVRERWPAAAATVARSAAHCAEASRLLAAVAADDAEAVLDEGRLSIDALGRLTAERQVNLVRWWLRGAGLDTPPAARLAAAMPDFFRARPDAAPCLRWEGGELRRYRGRLYALPALADSPAFAAPAGQARWTLGPGLGSLELVPTGEGGLCARQAEGAEIRFRAGGESLRPHPARPRKRLKDLCQEAGIVPWMRDRLPLVYLGSRLAAVGDLWIDTEFAAPPGRPALKPVWTGRPRVY
jgi:tRNA(Ile)-lysidine synthase